jgi:hypothetical protein
VEKPFACMASYLFLVVSLLLLVFNKRAAHLTIRENLRRDPVDGWFNNLLFQRFMMCFLGIAFLATSLYMIFLWDKRC